MQDPNVSVDQLSSIVLSEPVLTTRLLRIANSAMMRRGPIEITNVKTAISRLGFDMVQTAAVSLTFNETFRAPDGSSLAKYLDALRKHSIKVAALAYILAKNVPSVRSPDEALLAGLLHTIGKFYILIRANAFPELFANPDALEQLISAWHTGVGRAIVESWGYPEQIVEAVDEHELIQRDRSGPADITDIVIVANLLAKAEEGSTTEPLDLDQIPSLRRMNIDAEMLQKLIAESDEEIRSMAQAFSN